MWLANNAAILFIAALSLVLGRCNANTGSISQKVEYVFHIVVDGLRPTYMKGHTNFDWLRENGVCTLDARHDPVTSQTLPNHIDMFSGQLVSQHRYEKDADVMDRLPPMENIFELVKSNRKSTAFYGSKEKFDLLNRSWRPDRFVYDKRAKDLIPLALKEIKNNHYNFVFLHIRSPDRAGHKYKGAKTDMYRASVREADGYLGDVRALIQSDSKLRGNTAIILTADHGFTDYGNHADEEHRQNYQIPFCTWGPNVKPGADLYELNRGSVSNPYGKRGENMKVIRNAYAGPLAADWLGMSPTRGAMANQYLAVGDTMRKKRKEKRGSTPMPTAQPRAAPNRKKRKEKRGSTPMPTAQPRAAPNRKKRKEKRGSTPMPTAQPTAAPNLPPNRIDQTTDIYLLDGATFGENLPERNYNVDDYGLILVNQDPRLDAVLRFELPSDIDEGSILEVVLEVETLYGDEPIGGWVYQGESNNWSPTTVNWNNIPGFDHSDHVGTFEATEEQGISRAVLNGIVSIDGYVILMMVAGTNGNYSALASNAKLTVTKMG